MRCRAFEQPLSAPLAPIYKMNTTFRIVYVALKQLSEITGLTYNEINVFVYYIVIPMIYLTMVDKIMKKHILKIVFAGMVITTAVFVDLEKFSDSLFDASVQFLLWFKVFGWNYIVASVIICLVIPLIVFGVLFYFSYWPGLKNTLKDKAGKK